MAEHFPCPFHGFRSDMIGLWGMPGCAYCCDPEAAREWYEWDRDKYGSPPNRNCVVCSYLGEHCGCG